MASQSESVLMGRNLVSFGASVSASQRADVMDCLLYAQQSADGKYDRSRNWRQWIDQYQRIIYRNGARISGAIDPVRISIQNVRELRYLALQISGSATSPALRGLLERSIHKLMDSAHATAFFNSWFSSGRSESMQVIPCESRGDGSVEILVCGLQMTTSVVKPGFFFWDVLSGEMTVNSNGGSFLMTEESYAPYRESVTAYLTAHSQQALLEL